MRRSPWFQPLPEPRSELPKAIYEKPQWSQPLPLPELALTKEHSRKFKFGDALLMIIPVLIVCWIAWSVSSEILKSQSKDQHWVPAPAGSIFDAPTPPARSQPVGTLRGSLFGTSPRSTPPESPPPSSPLELKVPFKMLSHSIHLPGVVNNAVNVDFTLDTGATITSIPPDIYLALVRAGAISRADLRGQTNFTMADGHVSSARIFIIRSLRFGKVSTENIVAAIGGPDALLGQSFLGRFDSMSIDNRQSVIVLKWHRA